jgi:hypothetical protein
MGIGLIAVVPADRAGEALERAPEGIRVGTVTRGDGTVKMEGARRW